MKNNTVTDYTVYSDLKSEAWVAALNVLAVEFLVKTNQPEKYSHYCELLNSLDDDDLEELHVCLDLNKHITSLGHMISHNDYDEVRDEVFEYLGKD